MRLILLGILACLLGGSVAGWAQAPSPVQEIETLISQGVQAQEKGDSAGAEKAWQTALEKAAASKEGRRVPTLLTLLGMLYVNQQRTDKALDYFQRALVGARSMQNRRLEAHLLYSLGKVHHDLNQMNTAFDYMAQALPLFEALGDKEQTANALNLLGNYAFNLGDYEKARDYYLRADSLLTAQGRTQAILTNLDSLCSANERLGLFDQALAGALRMLTLNERIGSQEGIAHAYDSVGVFYYRLGQLDQAIDSFQRALKIYKSLNDPAEIAATLHNIGAYYLKTEQAALARDYLQQALVIKTRLNQPYQMAITHIGLGVAYAKLGDYTQALDYHRRALTYYQSIGDPLEIAHNLNYMGQVYVETGAFPKALDCFQRALAFRKRQGNPRELALVYSNLADFYERQGKLAEAETQYAAARQELERLSAQIGDPAQLGAVQEVLPDFYGRYAGLRAQRNQKTDALLMAEQGRAQGLLRQMALSQTRLDHFLTSQEATDLRRRTAALTQASARLQLLRGRSAPTTAAAQQRFADDLAETIRQNDEAERRWRLLRASLFLNHPTYRLLQGAEPLTAEKLHSLALRHPDTLYLEWAVAGKKRTWLFALSARKGLRAFPIPCGKRQLEAAVAAWRTALLQQTGDEPKQARKLYSLLLGPIEEEMAHSSISHLVLVPDGPLLDAPFAALLDRAGRRLVDRFALSASVSLGLLTWSDRRDTPSGTLLCAADPLGDEKQPVSSPSRGRFGALPFARRESEALGRLFPGSVRLLGPEAREAEIKRRMGQFSLLHFATHGFLDSRNGLRSGLVLASETEGSGEDGLLEAREIAEMRLSARMVVLSACETGQGKKSGGEGLLGLAWAFRAAGCPSVVATQWKVDDAATEQLMVAFYRALRAGKSKDEALRNAMRTIKRGKPAPYYWAAFQVIGDTSALSLRPGSAAGR